MLQDPQSVHFSSIFLPLLFKLSNFYYPILKFTELPSNLHSAIKPINWNFLVIAIFNSKIPIWYSIIYSVFLQGISISALF